MHEIWLNIHHVCNDFNTLKIRCKGFFKNFFKISQTTVKFIDVGRARIYIFGKQRLCH